MEDTIGAVASARPVGDERSTRRVRLVLSSAEAESVDADTGAYTWRLDPSKLFSLRDVGHKLPDGGTAGVDDDEVAVVRVLAVSLAVPVVGFIIPE